MSATAPGELSAATVIGLIEQDAYPRDVVTTIARGFLPLPQEELMGVLLYLATTDDAEVAGHARESLAEIPSKTIFAYATSDQIASEHLLRLLSLTHDNLVVEALIRNRSVSDAAIADLARRADPAVQEVIVINQARIIRAPEILEALFDNPALSPDVRRRALETREEFFEKRARVEQLEAEHAAAEEAEVDEEAPLELISDLLEKAEEQKDAPLTLALSEGERSDPDKTALWTRILAMTTSQKVMLAFRGDRSARMLLVRDRNKLICTAVMRNPRMTEQEAENVATMRNVEEEVLRLLGLRRDWMSKYNIMLNLVRNPKAPLGVVLPFINRLTLRDLKGLKDDRGVQQGVRDTARRAYVQRTQKK